MKQPSESRSTDASTTSTQGGKPHESEQNGVLCDLDEQDIGGQHMNRIHSLTTYRFRLVHIGLIYNTKFNSKLNSFKCSVHGLRRLFNQIVFLII